MIAVLSMITGFFFMGHRAMQDKTTSKISYANNKADLVINKFHHTATRKGIKDWELTAGSASYYNGKNMAVFQSPSVTFFRKNSKTSHLEAKQGRLNTDSNNIEISGNIFIKDENYQIETEKLHYNHNERIIYANVPVTISGQNLNFKAASMTFDLEKNRIQLQGNVQGIINVKKGL